MKYIHEIEQIQLFVAVEDRVVRRTKERATIGKHAEADRQFQRQEMKEPDVTILV